MSEPLRTAPSAAPATDAEREALIEKLLLAGLDHYFEGSYEQAVNVWTRVVFLERGHGRARAYIERARGALAERQRQAEELLYRGVAAYEAGDLPAARDLLTRAVADGSVNETALVFLQRLGRVEVAEGRGPAGSAVRLAGASAGGFPLPRSGRGRRFRRPRFRGTAGKGATNWFTTIAVSALVAGAILLAAQPIASWLGELPVSAPVIESRAPEPLPIIRAAEARVARARDLYAGGRLRDALRLLDTIDPADPFRAQADRLTSEIQRDLLATVAPPPASAGRVAR